MAAHLGAQSHLYLPHSFPIRDVMSPEHPVYNDPELVHRPHPLFGQPPGEEVSRQQGLAGLVWTLAGFFLGQGQNKPSQEGQGSCAGQAALGRR